VALVSTSLLLLSFTLLHAHGWPPWFSVLGLGDQQALPRSTTATCSNHCHRSVPRVVWVLCGHMLYTWVTRDHDLDWCLSLGSCLLYVSIASGVRVNRQFSKYHWVIILSLCHLIKRQLIVSRSSVEAEYRVFCQCCRRAISCSR
jgi:hypothetical protein